MAVYIILVIFCLFFTWLQQVRAMKNGVKYSYFLVFLFLALRHDYGNDYFNYFSNYLGLKSLQDEDFYFKGSEYGWLYLNYFFQFLFGDVGFHVMLGSIAAFTCFVLYRFTIKYIPQKYYIFAMALLLLEPNNILVLSSGMRQSIAVAIFLLSFDYLLQRKYLQYLLLIVLASLFHTSAMVFIVLIFLNIVNWRIYLPYVFLIFLGFFLLINNLSAFFNQIDHFLETQGSIYAIYTSDGFIKKKYGLGFALSIFTYFGALILNRKANFTMQLNTINKILIVALFFLILSLTVEIGTRLNYYTFPLIVSAYTITLGHIDKFKFSAYPLISRLAPLIIVAFFAYQNYLFWKSEVYSPYFTEYKTIFQSPLLK